jgi:hypothetical protein
MVDPQAVARIDIGFCALGHACARADRSRNRDRCHSRIR